MFHLKKKHCNRIEGVTWQKSGSSFLSVGWWGSREDGGRGWLLLLLRLLYSLVAPPPIEYTGKKKHMVR